MKGNSKPYHNTNPHNTSPLIWCASIICAIIAVVVIIGGIVVFIGYLTIKPKVPLVRVSRAQLDTIYFDQASLLTLQLTIVIRAENDNARAHATFYDTGYDLIFRGQKIAYLTAGSYDVRANRSLELSYEPQVTSIPLNSEDADAVSSSLRQGSIDFELKGTTRTRWRIWLVGSVKFWLHLDCQLHLPVDKTPVYPPKCSSRSK